MNKESQNPESITRIDVWSKGHTKKDSSTSNKAVSEAMEKIREYRVSVASSLGIGDDALSKLLGPRHGGRVRGLGSGVTPSKVGIVSQNKAHVIQLQEEVQQGGSFVDLNTSIPDVTTLSENMMHPSRDIDVSKAQRVETGNILEPRVETTSKSSSPPQARGNTNMLGRKCKLMNWKAEEELVAIGRWDTNEPNTMVHSVRLREDASRVWVDNVINDLAPLWRINSFMETVADAKGYTIA